MQESMHQQRPSASRSSIPESRGCSPPSWFLVWDTASSNARSAGRVCPTGAIATLSPEAKRKFVIGTAVFDGNRCLPMHPTRRAWSARSIAPVWDKAIKFREVTIGGRDGNPVALKQPYVREDLCIGCGICENKCPLHGDAAIRVFVRQEPPDAYDPYGESK
ncbi:MAG: 4Fe-4S binding protein [Marinilabiliales bacterium]|nr:4Fe-4S binding protein [Marinilabiliales bacterium]